MNTYFSHIQYFVKLLGDISQGPLASVDLSLLLDRGIWHRLEQGTYFGINEFSIRISEEVYGEEHEAS